MSDTVGRIDLILDIDGDGLSSKVRRVGEEAGRDAGRGYNKGFDGETTDLADSVSKKMRKSGKDSGSEFEKGISEALARRKVKMQREVSDIFSDPKGLQSYFSKFDSAGAANDSLQGKLRALRKEQGLSNEEWQGLRKAVTAFKNESVKLEDEQSRAAEGERLMAQAARANADARRDLTRELDRNNTALRDIQFARVNGALRDMQRRTQEAEKAQRDLNRAWDQAIGINRRFDAQVERTAQQAQRAMDQAWRRAIADGQRDAASLERLRLSTAQVFSGGDESIRRYVSRFPTAHEGISRLTADVERLHGRSVITDEDFHRLTGRIDEFSNEMNRGEGFFKRFLSVFDRGSKSTSGFNNNLSQTPRILKLILGYTALFTALSGGIAVLGSVAGSSILALATNIGALGIAAAVLIPGFKGMLGSISALPAAARPAARAMQAFNKPLHDLQDTIQVGLFSGLAPQINHLRTTIFPVLTAGLGETAKTMNNIFTNLIAGITSDDGVGRLTHIFDGLQPILTNLGTTFINLGGVIAKLFDAALPSGLKFSQFLSDLIARFSTFLSSPVGQDALTDFFGTLSTVMPHIIELVGTAGNFVADLVTPDTIGDLDAMLDAVSGFLPVLNKIVQAVLKAHPLSVFAGALKDIGDAIGPSTPALGKLAAAVGKFVSSGIKDIAPIFGDLLKQGLRVANDLFPVLATSIEEILETPGLSKDLGKIFKDLADAFIALAPVIPPLTDAIVKLLPPLLSLVQFLAGNLRDGIDALSTLVSILLTPINGDFLSKALDHILDMFDRFSKQKDGIVGALNGIITKITGTSPATLFDDFLGKSDKAKKAADDFGAHVSNMGVTSQAAGSNVKSAAISIGGSFDDVNTKAKDTSTGVGIAFGGIPSLLGVSLGPVGQTVANAFAPALAAGAEAASNISHGFDVVPGLVGQALGSMGAVFQNGFSAAGEVGQTAVVNLTSVFAAAPGRVQSFLSSMGSVFSGTFSGAAGIAGNAVSNLTSPFAAAAGRIGGYLSGVGRSISGAFAGAGAAASAAVENIVRYFQGLPGRISAAIGGIGGRIASAFSGIGGIHIPGFAKGGILTSPTLSVAGEAGPEAYVPLSKPLSQVDPSVRALAAFAQGKFPAASASGGVAQKVTTFAAGSIIVSTPNADPVNAANAILDRIANDL